MNRTLLSGLAGLALATGMAGPALAATPKTQAQPGLAWKDYVAKTIADWMAISPADAVYQGAHQYDGKMPDWSEAGLKASADFYRQAIAGAKAYRSLTGAEAFERDYLVQVFAGKLFWIEDADQPHTNPAFYVGGGLDPNVYVSRDYADKPTRMKAMIAFFETIPAAARNIRANLNKPLPASFIKYGVAGFGGFGEYYRGDARAAFADVQDPALQAKFRTTSEAAGQAMADLSTWLKAQPPAPEGSYALGADRFARMVKATEGVDVPLAELERVGRADLKRNQDALKVACNQFAPGATIIACFDKLNADKPKEGPVAAATRQIPELNAFVRQHDLVTIPGTEQALVRESPPYNRQNSAYIDPAGPLEKGIPSIYYISPPDPAWSQEKQLEYIPGEKDLLFTSVHEVMPGHFLQFLHSNRTPSQVGRLFVGYAFAEGWAHYSEEMMVEAGLDGGAAVTRVGQISNALLRNCRYLSAIGLHSGTLTQAQSDEMFRKECYQGAGTAEQQAARGTYDPAYLNYTLGKLMIRKLRTDWTAKHGGRGAWKAFHDQFLSYGGPPVPLVRKAMMQEPTAKAVF
ncbi:DUF885 domain-containing protein [Novosphingobium sp. PS1R-30]|uniref:DUF885 domain-containing protein n=1 Tax=Novosphingobium anseongense TaxID=3133436 RepID=A0ABU8RXY5_9SPHN